MNIIAVDNHVAQIDADAERDPLVLGQSRIAFGDCRLCLHGGADGINNAGKFREHAIAHELNNAAIVLGKYGLDEVGA